MSGDLGGLGDVGEVGGIPEIDIPDFGDIGGMGDIGDMGIGDMMNDLDLLKPTMTGFWDWIKQGWEDYKVWFIDGYSAIWEWIKGWKVWTWIGDAIGSLVEWATPAWHIVQATWSIFLDWVGNFFGGIWTGVKNAWNAFLSWASRMWDGTKEVWGNFTTWVSDGFSKLWGGVKSLL